MDGTINLGAQLSEVTFGLARMGATHASHAKYQVSRLMNLDKS